MPVDEEQEARNRYKHLKTKIRVLLEQVETPVGATPISVPLLKLRVEDAKGSWDEFVQQYVKLRNYTFDNVQHADFQRRYQRVIALADSALIEDE